MADDTERLVVQLEARITDFEKNFIKAAKTANDNFSNIERRAQQSSSRLEAGFGKAGAVALGDLKSRADGAASQLGVVGSVMRALGPVGAIAAAGIGAVWLALNKVGDGAKAFREMARGLKEASDVTGLSTTQFQAVTDIFQQHGISAQQSGEALAKFAAERANAAKGSGELYDALRRVNAALAEQFASSRTTGDALNVLATATTKADGATQAFLSRAAFGRGTAGIAPALLDIAGRGGLGAVTDAAVKAGVAFDEGVIKKQAEAAVAAERNARLVENNWNRAYSIISDRWKGFKKALGLDSENELKISIAVRQSAENTLPVGERSIEALQEQAAKLRAEIAKFGPQLEEDLTRPVFAGEIRLRRLQQQLTQINDTIEKRQATPTVNANDRVKEVFSAFSSDNKPKSPVEETNDLERKTNLEKQRLALLGDTATIAERVAQKEREVSLARRTGADVSDKEARRVVESYKYQLDAARLSVREKENVATADEKLALKERELDEQVRQGTLSLQDRNKALTIFKLELEESTKFDPVKLSTMPSLSRFSIEAGDLKTQLDSGLTSSVRQLGSEFSLMNGSLSPLNRSALTFGQRMRAVALRLADTLTQMIAMKLILGPLAGALGGGLGNLVGAPSIGGTAPATLAEGGIINGPGTSTSDSIHAMVSTGEYIVNARSTAKHRALIEAVNADRLPRFASGGIVPPAMPSKGLSLGGDTVNSTIHVNVNGTGSNQSQNQDLAERIVKQIGNSMDSRIDGRLRTQMRPNGMLSSR